MKKIALVLLATMTGCVTAPTARQFERRAEMPAPFATVWDAVIDTFGENNWSISTLERESGIITTDWMRVDESHMDCGSPGLNSDRDHQVRFNVIVREASGGSHLTVNTTWQVYRHYGNAPGTWTECLSRGSIERVIHELVLTKVSQ